MPKTCPKSTRGAQSSGDWTRMLIAGTVVLIVLALASRGCSHRTISESIVEPWSSVVATFAFAALLVAFVVALILSIAVYRDAARLNVEDPDHLPVLLPPWAWAATTLVGGIVVAGVYWAIHHLQLQGHYALRGIPTPKDEPAERAP